MLLNADIGEGLESDTQLFPYLDQANIACGGHIGDQQSMRQAVKACLANNIMIGAHPSYPDPDGFGRRSFAISDTKLVDSLNQQIQSLADTCDSFGTRLRYIKPHGALYNNMMQQTHLFDLVIELIVNRAEKLDLMLGAGLSDEYYQKAQQADVRIIREAFADRQYLQSCLLAPRTQKGAVYTDVNKICSQVSDLSNGIVKDQLGNPIELSAETICIHGDNIASVKSIAQIAQILNN